MITFACMVRKFKDKFYFIDRLEFDKDKNYWFFSWPSSVAPLRFFGEEGLFKVMAHETDKGLWILKAERAKVKVRRLFLTDENCTAIVWIAINTIKLKALQLDELILSVDEAIKKKIKQLDLPCKVVFLA